MARLKREDLDQVLTVINRSLPDGEKLELDWSSQGYRLSRSKNGNNVGLRMPISEMKIFLDGMEEFADLQYVIGVEHDRRVANG